jgi:4-diphosphocytidyl-2-C-methyl-D-erythritol kinase
LLIPKIGVSTAEAYHWVDVAHRDTGRRGAIALDQDSLSSWGSIGRLAGNDFESAVFGHHPEIRQAFEALAKTHPLVCRMSGSGSALFAVYKNDGMRDDAVMMLGRKFGEVEAVVVGG